MTITTTHNSQEFVLEQKNIPFNISIDDLVKIVEKASSISERISAEFVSNKVEENQNRINSRLEKWCQVSAHGSQQKFIKRLAWDNLDINTVRRVLGNVSLLNKQHLPSWTYTLKEVMEVANSIAHKIFLQSDSEQSQYINSDKPLPFEEIFIPFIKVAKKKLIECAGSSYELLSATAHATLEQSLIAQLSTIFVLPLNLEFSLVRSCSASQLAGLIEQLQKNSSKQKYTEFVRSLLNDGLLSFFQEYSVAARLAAIVTDFWVEAVKEFLYRLASDWEKIQQTFHGGQELGQVVAVEASLSDPHNRGRSVTIVKFASDLKLVYKPKNLGLEQAYFEFLTWINQQRVALPLKVLKILNCSTHGWVEFVEALPCEDQQAVRRYYQRAGLILCLTYALKGTDFHYENLIACGEQPVLIDLETLLYNDIQIQEENDNAIFLARKKLRHSVAATALLPGMYIPAGYTAEAAVDVCGLGNMDADQISLPVLKWNHINTDSMVIVVEQETKSLSSIFKNQPFGENIDTSISHYSEEVIAGFQQMYQFLIQRKEVLLAVNSPLAIFADQKVRLVVRDTNLYNIILSNSLHPQYLRDGVERSIELDILSRSFLSSENKSPLWAMIAAEKQALEQLDIPYISSYSKRNDIIINSETKIENFFKVSSYDRVVCHLQEMSDENLAEQMSLIKSSLYSCLTDEDQDESTLQKSELSLNTVVTLEEDVILQQAIAIAQELQQRAIRGNQNDAAWLGMKYISKTQRFQLGLLNFNLYDGCCGIALFLAALANVTGKAEFGELALGSLHSLREIVYEKDSQVQQTLIENIGVGGAKGFASIVYTFVRISEFLGESKLIRDAMCLASWMTVDKATINQTPGIVNGAAGVILSLLALYNSTENTETLVQATTWGQHLLDTRITTNAGHKIWANSDGEPLIGFSEGIAGIAYALVQLYAVTKDSVFLSAAQEAVHYEQSSFSSRGDFLNSKKDTLSSINSWCHGLPGVILARLGGLAILDTNEIRQELEMDLQQMLQSRLQVLDNLCCGNLGYIDALLVAAERLSRPELLEIAHKQIALVLHRSKQVGSFQLLPNLSPDIYNPCFCQGTAGIGYELLRFLYPQKLTSVLLWQ